jgi:hypothetical protein
MSSTAELLLHQRNLAMAQGLTPDDRGYLSGVASNLPCALKLQTRSAFEAGSGSELRITVKVYLIHRCYH